MILSVHQPQYLPWLGYFDKIARSDIFLFLDDVQYKKREWQNRNRIKIPAGLSWLTVPVKYNSHDNICDIAIQNEFPWGENHLRSIEMNYRKATYFNEYIRLFSGVLNAKWESLCRLNCKLIEIICGILDIKTKIMFSSEHAVKTMKTDRIIELCACTGVDTYLSGVGAKDYLEEDKFVNKGLSLQYQDFKHPVYTQLFGDFLPYASVIDLIFNEGKNSGNILKGRG